MNSDETLAGPSKVEGFAEKVIEILSHGMFSLMISVWHRAGLFDAMSGLRPSTSEEIARVAKLDERYVREWLGAMVTVGTVEYDPATCKYHLPPQEHAVCLTHARQESTTSPC